MPSRGPLQQLNAATLTGVCKLRGSWRGWLTPVRTPPMPSTIISRPPGSVGALPLKSRQNWQQHRLKIVSGTRSGQSLRALPGGYDALTITVAVASLAGALHPDFIPIAESHARSHPGAAVALARPIPGHTDFNMLSSCPEDSLGLTLYKMIVENGYDPEVLDRESIKLSAMPHCLHYLNARILQMHDVWHLVAGYTTNSSNEIAISGFQLAQFGHNYSAMFLAAVATMSTIKEPRGFTILMQIIMEAWQHGRETPAMMDIEWESEWNNSLASIRAKYNISVYRSVFPADLLESIENPSLWRKLVMGYQLLRYNIQLRRGLLRPALQ